MTEARSGPGGRALDPVPGPALVLAGVVCLEGAAALARGATPAGG